MSKQLVALLLTAFTAGCSREEMKWIEVGTTPDMTFYMEQHVDTVTRNESSLTAAKMLWDYNYPQIRSEGEYKSVVVSLLIDCNHAKAADYGYTNYSANMASGMVVATGERDIRVAEYGLRDIQNPSTKAVADMACREAAKQ